MGSHGKVVYLEIPSEDVRGSAAFYRELFGWSIRERDDGALAFDDSSGEVSGAFRTGRPAQQEPGMLIYVKVTDVASSMRQVEAAGGVIVQPIGGDPGETTARFRDPYGNLLALYQEPGALTSAP